MSDELTAATEAAEASLRAFLGPWLEAEAHGTTLASQVRAAAWIAVRDAQPHLAPAAPAPPRTELSCTSATTERAWQPSPPRPAPAFGFTAPC